MKNQLMCFTLLTTAIILSACNGSGSTNNSETSSASNINKTNAIAATSSTCLQTQNLQFDTTNAPWYISGSFDIINTCQDNQQLQNTVILLTGGNSDDKWTASGFSIDNLNPSIDGGPVYSAITNSNKSSQLQITFQNSYLLEYNNTMIVSFGYNNLDPSLYPLTTDGATVAIAGTNPDGADNGILNFTLINPDTSVFSTESTPVILEQVNSGDITTIFSTLNELESVSLVPTNYVFIPQGVADASLGVYYDYESQVESITATTVANLGDIVAKSNTTPKLTDTITITGLQQGDSLILNFSDSRYTYNQEIVTATEESTDISIPYMFLTNDKVTLNVEIKSAVNYYQAVTPLTISNDQAASYTIALAQITPPSIVHGAYKDVGVSLNWSGTIDNWQLYELGTTAGSLNQGSATSLVSALNSGGFNVVTWAFATGDCTDEDWAGAPTDQFIQTNVQASVNNNIYYIVSTGGAAGGFTCSNANDLIAFADRYKSANLLGFDFDIEGGHINNTQLTSLVNAIKGLKAARPNLRISFTLPTLAGTTDSSVALTSNQNGSGGVEVMAAIANSGLTEYYVNLMAMDYANEGQATANECYIDPTTGLCEMGQSAIQAAIDFSKQYPNFPMNYLELTPLIGVNDIPDEIFYLSDATIVNNYVKMNGLGGLHYWSFDRDVPCTSNITTTCDGLTDSSATPFMFGEALK